MDHNNQIQQPVARPMPQQPMPQQPMPPRPPVQYIPPVQPYYYSPAQAPVPQEKPFPTGKRELIFGVFILLCSLMLCNFTLFGGFNLGFAIGAVACIVCSVVYLRAGGCRINGYSGALLALSVIICAGFARSDDGFVKFVLVCFLLLAVNLALCLMAGQNLHSPGGIRSLLDPFRSALLFGIGAMSPAFRGLGVMFKEGGPAVKKGSAVLIGLAVAVPLVCILIPLLMSADAAFSGLLNLLPEFRIMELVLTLLFATVAACVLYTRGTALRHKPKAEPATGGAGGAVSHLTVNTVLGVVCGIYAVYLVSQLAYFVGGFAGILPEGFTAAEYARRGFFEMAWLCAIDLSVMALAVGLVKKEQDRAPLATRLLCLFIGLVTVFLVVTASAKMGLYISSYGLTRLRVLTEVIMVFLGIATIMVCIWLFAPKMPYMKAVLLVALAMGAVTLWADVDTVVAAYNVGAYKSGALERVDVGYLGRLGDGAIPYIEQLTQDPDPAVALLAKEILREHTSDYRDFRNWNYADWQARGYGQEEMN